MEPINWKYNKTKHLTIPLSINGNKLLFILDTGASNTVIDFSIANKIGLNLKIHHNKGVGVGSSSLKVYKVGKTIINFQNLINLSSNNIISMNLSHVIDGLITKGAKRIDGVIGNDILKKYEAKIDYTKKTLQFCSFKKDKT
jgi:hypothetical protein